MNEFKLIDSNQYLKDKLKQSDDKKLSDEILRSVSKLEKCIISTDECAKFDDNDINLSFNEEKFDLNFRYSKAECSQDQLEEIAAFHLDYKGKCSGDFRILEDFSFMLKGGKKFDLKLSEIVPSGYKVIFDPQVHSEIPFNGFVDEKNKFIYFVGDITSLSFQITLFHEVGHIIDYENLERLGVKKMVTDHKLSYEAEKLRRERFASAYATSKLKPLIRANVISKLDLLNDLKYYALNSYCLNIERDIWKKGVGDKFESSLNHFTKMLEEHQRLIDLHNELMNELRNKTIDDDAEIDKLEKLIDENEKSIEEYEEILNEYESGLDEYGKVIDELFKEDNEDDKN